MIAHNPVTTAKIYKVYERPKLLSNNFHGNNKYHYSQH